MDHVQPQLSSPVRSAGRARDYWRLAKPGIVGGNLLAAGGGLFLGARGAPDPGLLAATLAGIALVIASACVLNNWLDRDLDRRMARTRARALASGAVPPRKALAWAAMLGVSGCAILLARDNLLAVAFVLSGFAVYVGLYSLWLKRRTPWATWVGSLAGAAPPVAGYCAASGQFDHCAAWLAAIFCLWQIPHFHAIAIRRLEDYRAAAIPVAAVKLGVAAAKRQMAACILAYVLLSQLPDCVGGRAYAYHAATGAAGVLWLYLAGQGLGWTGAPPADDRAWARRTFLASLLAVCALSVMIVLNSIAEL